MLFKTLLSYLQNEHNDSVGDVFQKTLKRFNIEKTSGNKKFNSL
jgi:hypothetical protein